MSEFKILDVVRVDDWKGNYGPMKAFQLRVEGPDGEVEVDLNQKPETPFPKVGAVIEGHLEDGKYRPKLKKDQPQGGATGGARSDKQHAVSGERDAGPSIEAQVSLKVAGEVIAAGQGSTSDLKRLTLEGFEAIQEAKGIEPQQVAKAVSDTSEALSTPPSQREQANGPVSQEELTEAYTAFLDGAGEKGSPDREKAKKNVELRMAALGITDPGSMSSNQTRELMTFLRSDG